MTSQAYRVQSNEIQWFIPLSCDTQTNISEFVIVVVGQLLDFRNMDCSYLPARVIKSNCGLRKPQCNFKRLALAEADL